MSNGEQWHETFIYQQTGDTRNGPHKEGGNFRNLGHETQHSLFYALIGQQELHCLPSWTIEGAANALGNESCFKEEADYIKASQARLPSLERITHMSYTNGADLYYFGSALFRFILEKYPNVLKVMILKARKKESNDDISHFIKENLKDYDQEFKEWLNKKIDFCSSKDSSSNRTEEIKATDIQTQYRKDLNRNKKLKKFLGDESVEFEFKDTVFKLEVNQISRHHIDKAKTSQTITLSDYDWFKSALEIYVLDNQLTNLNITQQKDSIIESLVDSKREQLAARKLLKIVINAAEPLFESKKTLNSALNLFVLDKGFNLSKPLRKSFERQGQSSAALEKILTSQSSKELRCKRYTENLSSDTMFSDEFSHINFPSNAIEINEEVNNIYKKSLDVNQALKQLIKKEQAIKFTFKDTVFVLSLDKISRHDLNENPQGISEGDFAWFLSALEIYAINNLLSKKKLTDTRSIIAQILNRDPKYISNRWIRNIDPNKDKCFIRSQIQDFVSSLDSSGLIKNRRNQLIDKLDNHELANQQPPINGTFVLGGLNLLSNVSLMLTSLGSKPRELTHVNDDACDEDNSNANNVNWLTIGGGITAIIALVAGGYVVWNYFRKKSNDNHSNLGLKKDPASEENKGVPELEKLNSDYFQPIFGGQQQSLLSVTSSNRSQQENNLSTTFEGLTFKFASDPNNENSGQGNKVVYDIPKIRRN